MKKLFTDYRIRKILNPCMDALQQGASVDQILADYPHLTNELRPILETADWLFHQEKSISLTPDLREAGRQRLVANIHRSRTRPLHRFQRRLNWFSYYLRPVFNTAVIVLSLLVLVTFTAEVFEAARNTLPGDILYPAKIVAEQVQLITLLNVDQQAQAQVAITRQRISETESLLLEERYENLYKHMATLKDQIARADHAVQTLSRTNPQLALALAKELQVSFFTHMLVLDALKGTVPPYAKARVEQALSLTAR